jgi:hypothetical protein
MFLHRPKAAPIWLGDDNFGFKYIHLPGNLALGFVVLTVDRYMLAGESGVCYYPSFQSAAPRRPELNGH